MRKKLSDKAFDTVANLLGIEADSTQSEKKIIGSAGEPTVHFGKRDIPVSLSTLHFLAIGTTGSGKTKILQMLMKSAFALFSTHPLYSAVIYDTKRDMIPFLYGIPQIRDKIRILNPLDDRRIAWDIAKDITDTRLAQTIARIICPKEGHDPFWSNAAMDLLTGVFQTFITTAPEKWQFRDVYLACQTPSTLKHILEQDITGANAPRLHYFDSDKTFASIFSHLRTNMMLFEVIATSWYHAKEKLSLSDILDQGLIAVFGQDEDNRPIVDAMNAFMLKRFSEIVLSREDTPNGYNGKMHRRIWLFLDEFREAGRVDGMRQLLNKGRSKGASVWIGLQDVAGMRDQSTGYGQFEANEILGLASFCALLRSNSPETRGYESERIGYKRENVASISESTSFHPLRGESASYSLQTLPKVMPDKFGELPLTSLSYGLSGYWVFPVLQKGDEDYKEIYYSPSEVETLSSPLTETKEKGFDSLKREHQELKLWNTGDYTRLKIKPVSQVIVSQTTAAPTQEITNQTASAPEERREVRLPSAREIMTAIQNAR